MTENKIAIYIDGINRTHNLVYPVKFGELLDEQLDTATVSLRQVRKRSFAPLTPVEIHLQPIVHGRALPKEVLHYLVNADSAENKPVGSNRYNHELSLVEPTKYAEVVICDTLTFTNALGKIYTENQSQVVPTEG